MVPPAETDLRVSSHAVAETYTATTVPPTVTASDTIMSAQSGVAPTVPPVVQQSPSQPSLWPRGGSTHIASAPLAAGGGGGGSLGGGDVPTGDAMTGLTAFIDSMLPYSGGNGAGGDLGSVGVGVRSEGGVGGQHVLPSDVSAAAAPPSKSIPPSIRPNPPSVGSVASSVSSSGSKHTTAGPAASSSSAMSPDASGRLSSTAAQAAALRGSASTASNESLPNRPPRGAGVRHAKSDGGGGGAAAAGGGGVVAPRLSAQLLSGVGGANETVIPPSMSRAEAMRRDLEAAVARSMAPSPDPPLRDPRTLDVNGGGGDVVVVVGGGGHHAVAMPSSSASVPPPAQLDRSESVASTTSSHTRRPGGLLGRPVAVPHAPLMPLKASTFAQALPLE